MVLNMTVFKNSVMNSEDKKCHLILAQPIILQIYVFVFYFVVNTLGVIHEM